jgi:hypothetical protein
LGFDIFILCNMCHENLMRDTFNKLNPSQIVDTLNFVANEINELYELLWSKRISFADATLDNVSEVNLVHHILVWAVSTVENSLTAQLILADGTGSKLIAKIKHDLKHTVEHMDIQHVTLEMESESDRCEQVEC